MFVKVGHSYCYRLCRLGISISDRSENKPNPETRKPHGKNQKFPRYLKNPKNLKSSEKNENHAVGYSNYQQLEKNNEKNLGRMREILGAYRKKTNNAKKSAMKFRNIDIWMVRYLTGHVASRNQQSVSESVHKWLYYIDSKKIDFSRKPNWRSEIEWVTSKDRFFDHNSKSWKGGLFKFTSEIVRGSTVTVTYHTSFSPPKLIRIWYFYKFT